MPEGAKNVRGHLGAAAFGLSPLPSANVLRGLLAAKHDDELGKHRARNVFRKPPEIGAQKVPDFVSLNVFDLGVP